MQPVSHSQSAPRARTYKKRDLYYLLAHSHTGCRWRLLLLLAASAPLLNEKQERISQFIEMLRGHWWATASCKERESGAAIIIIAGAWCILMARSFIVRPSLITHAPPHLPHSKTYTHARTRSLICLRKQAKVSLKIDACTRTARRGNG